MLTTTPTIVQPSALKELVAAGVVTGARVEPADQGLVILFRTGMSERVLGAARGKRVRYLKSLDGAASVLQDYGIVHFEVDTAHWVPNTMVRGYKSSNAPKVVPGSKTKEGEH